MRFLSFLGLTVWIALMLGCGGGDSETSDDCRTVGCADDASCQLNSGGDYECLPMNQGGAAGEGGMAGDGGAAGEGGNAGQDDAMGGSAGEGGESGNQAGGAGDGGGAGVMPSPCEAQSDGFIIAEGVFGDCEGFRNSCDTDG